MAKSENKTKATAKSVDEFLDAIPGEQRKKDSLVVFEMMKKITKMEPKMWGPTIVGFGQYHYKYATGREGDIFITGFSPRKQALTLYIMPGFDQYDDLMKQLGKYKTGVSCLYINKLDDVDLKVLQTLVKESFSYMKKKYKA